MKRGQVERLIAEAIADALKPLVDENGGVIKKLAATEAKIAAATKQVVELEAAPPKPSRLAEMLDTGTVVSRFN